VNHPSEVHEIGQPVKVKVLDIDRDRPRISLGLKQTQSDPWQQVLESYNQGDVVEGKVTKVVTFGAFVEIMPGVEGLVHISELAPHHVENPREVVSQGDTVKVKIIEVDAERRRLSLSLKRVEDGAPLRGPDEPAPQLDLSEDVFGADTAAAEEAIVPEGEADAEYAAAEDAIAPHGEADADYDAVAIAEPAIDEADDSAIGVVEEEPASPAADDGEPMAVFEPEPEPEVEAAPEEAEEAPEPQAAAPADDEQ
jgi:small subunit ribosomal protein S1